jgi:lysophospholipase L1-like esterase
MSQIFESLLPEDMVPVSRGASPGEMTWQTVGASFATVAQGALADTATQPEDLGLQRKQEIALDERWSETLRPIDVMDQPTMVWVDGQTGTLPDFYRPVICGTGSLVTGWNGQDTPTDTVFRIPFGDYLTGNGGQNDLEIHGSDRAGIAGYPWFPSFEADIGVGCTSFELIVYSTSFDLAKISINGAPAHTTGFSSAPTGLGSGKHLRVTFAAGSVPAVNGFRLKIEGINRWSGIKVPSGVAVTKPNDLLKRRMLYVGDSIANGSGSALRPGAGSVETHAAMTARALGGQQTTNAAIGGRGYTTSTPLSDATATLVTAGAQFDIAGVYASVNDPTDGTGVQAGIEAVLADIELMGSPAMTYVTGVFPGPGWEGNNAASAAAAAAAGVPYIDITGIIGGGGGRYGSADLDSNRAHMVIADGVHLSFAGHRAIGRYVFGEVSKLIDAL